nr:DUF2071 domain-containing protein [Streptomyces orinoci]
MQRLLPRGVTAGTHDGAAWVGLTPFAMTAVRPAGLPPTPYAFPETAMGPRAPCGRLPWRTSPGRCGTPPSRSCARR